MLRVKVTWMIDDKLNFDEQTVYGNMRYLPKIGDELRFQALQNTFFVSWGKVLERRQDGNVFLFRTNHRVYAVHLLVDGESGPTPQGGQNESLPNNVIKLSDYAKFCSEYGIHR